MDQDVMPGAPLALRGRVITPEAVLEDAVVVLRDGVVDYVGPLVTSPVAPPPPSDLTLLPGLVDVHCHGGGGAGFPDVGSPDQARAAVGEHLRHGTTSLVASLVTASRDTLLAPTATLPPLLASEERAG
ncbi:MAG TPA: amidohydrolase family protein, partial [Actinotalea sp.]|nr:amidohydrolase family protein [Actinotalea sp.]